jgi:DNA-binding transcriptional ArsR family regulator
MENEPVTIVDREVLKVLSVDTRMDIMKLLSDAEGGRTPSFVAKKLNKSDATIVEHLQTLSEAGLVKKTTAPGKKWVFYSLTDRGQGIVSSKSRRLVIILATSLVAMLFGLGGFANYFYTSGIFVGERFVAPSLEGAEKTLTGTEAVANVAVQPQTILLFVSVVLIVAAAAGLGFYFYKKSKFEGRTKFEGMIL